jgi:uncharacterized protein YdeI (YjbR/CyaY-like superfamily)
MKITKSFTPGNPKDWRSWLEKNHDHASEVWLVYFKPASGKSTIDYETSVEEALCFGWIDSIIQKIDENKYARKFNPRRMDSQWSETNKRRVVKMIREGRMTEAGMAKVTFEVGKVDVGQPKAERPPVEMPERIEQALRSQSGVWEAFQKVMPSLKRTYILWLSDAKKPETFERRLRLLMEEVLAGRPTSMH